MCIKKLYIELEASYGKLNLCGKLKKLTFVI